MILRPVRPQSACGPPSSNVARGVHPHLERVVGELLREHRPDHVLDEVGLHEPVAVDPRGVLGGDEHRLEALGDTVHVVDRDLGLAVGPQVRERARLADLGETVGEAVREPDRHRHEVFGLVAGVAEHHSLVAGADLVEAVAGAGALLDRLVDADRDVGRLVVDRRDDPAGVAVEPVGLAVVADATDGVAHDTRVCRCRPGC